MSVARNLATVGTATLLSRLLGFVRDAGVAALLGAGPLADAYVTALQIPNLFRRLLADGALNAAFVPIWLRIRGEGGPAAARTFGTQAIGTMLLVLGALALLCIVLAPSVVRTIAPGFETNGDRFDVAVTLLRLAVPYVAVAGVVAVAAAMLNAEGRVGAAAGGTVAFNCVLVGAVALVALMSDASTRFAAQVLAISFFVAGGVQLALVAAALVRLQLHPEALAVADTPATRDLYARALPVALVAGMPQFVLITGAIVASSSTSAVSWLYYANRLYELPLGIISIAVAAVLAPRIAAGILARDTHANAAAQSRALEIVLAIALPATAGLVLLATPITGVLFEHGAFGPEDTAAVAGALAAIAGGLAGHALEKLLSAVAFAHDDARTPTLTALAGLTVTTAVAILAFPRYGHVGVAAAIALSGWIGAVLLAIILWRRGWIAIERATWRRVLGIAFSAVVMGIVIALLQALTPAQAGAFVWRLAWLFFLVSIGMATYLLSLWRLGIADIRALIAAVRTQS